MIHHITNKKGLVELYTSISMTVCFAFLVTKFQAFCLTWFGLLHIDQKFPHDWQGINVHVRTQLSVVI